MNERKGAGHHVLGQCIVQYVLTSETREAALARVGRALADPTRCKLLVALLDGPSYPGRLAAGLGLSRSNVSNHLACLRGCGLVIAVWQGRQTRYEIADAHLAQALRELVKVVLAGESSEQCFDEAPVTESAEVAGEQ